MYSYNNIIDKQAPAQLQELDHEMANVLLSSSSGGHGDDSSGSGGKTLAASSTVPIIERFHAAGAQPVDAMLAHKLLTPDESRQLIDICEEKAEFSFWASGGKTVASASPSRTDGEEEAMEEEEARIPGERSARLLSSNDGITAALGEEKKDDAQARAFRSAYTVEGSFPALANELWKRISSAMPLPTKHYSPEMVGADELFERDMEGTWLPDSLSDNLLFARYLEGGHFAPHVDGSTIVDLNTRSLYTVLIYLNDCYGGGETHVLVGEQCDVLTKDEPSGKICGNGRNCIGSIVPREGSAVVFAYHVLHEGASVLPGHKKYIIRGDVLYRRVPPILTEPKDLEGFEMYQKARVLEANGHVDEALRLFQLTRRKSPGVAELYQL